MEKVIINSYEDFEKLVGQQIGVSEYVELSLLLIQVACAPTFGRQKGKKEASPMRWRTRQHPLGGGRGCAVIGELFCACTQISTQIFWRLISKCYICAVNQIYRLLCR